MMMILIWTSVTGHNLESIHEYLAIYQPVARFKYEIFVNVYVILLFMQHQQQHVHIYLFINNTIALTAQSI